jgi:fructosamine-3-kinase
MTTIPQGEKLRDKIESRTGCPIVDLRFYATGQNANLYLVDLTDDRRLMAKIMREGDDETPSTLEAEGWMLEYLARKTSLPVPRVHWCDANTILMDFVENSGVMSVKMQENAAEILAALHGVEADFFGLERDTTISPYIQPNHFESHWVEFFRDHRLLHMAREALNDGSIEPSTMQKIEKLAGRIDRFIGGGVKPSLIHGDLWGGNVLLGPDKIAAFIDPAIYYADPEMDLATIRLFDTFGDAFFQRYNEIRPIRRGFDTERRYIYALYPLLVNTRGSGNRYALEIDTILKRFVG